MTTDVFIVTQVGLDAAVDAAAHGIKLVLSSFRIGSAYGYTPTMSDTGLHGSTLYTDQITNFRISGDGSLVVTCTMSVDAGPFQFGEIGIYTQGGQLFCLAALAQLQTKYSSLGTNIASTYSFDAYIRLGQATSVIEVDSVTSVTYTQVVSALGYVPYNSSNPAGYLTAATGVTQNSNPQFASIGVGTGASGIVGQINAVGNIYTTGNILGMQTSDTKFKENMTRIANPLEVLRRITGYSFDWTDAYLKANEAPNPWIPKSDLGFSAQELQTTIPIATHVKPDGSLGIFPNKLMPYFLEGIKFLDNEGTKLRNRVQALESRVLALENASAS